MDAYLTAEGEIDSVVRPHVKKLMSALSLTALGFVPIHQAIIYSFKQDEGVPPNAILVGVSGKILSIYLYKIGSLVGSTRITSTDTIAKDVEEAIKGMPNVEVLPSRMLLYGGVTETLEEVKRQLLHHPWQTRVNFLHFPKIEILPLDQPLTAISIAGASEMSKDLGGSEEDEAPEHTTFGQPSRTVNETFRKAEAALDKAPTKTATGEETLAEVLAKEGVAPEVIPAEIVDSEELPTKKVEESAKANEEDTNVVPVAPETLGFRSKDVGETTLEKPKRSFQMPAFTLPSFFIGDGPKLGLIVGMVVLLFVLGD